jgi:predicted DNA-binding ribbon-helix-helix protein
VAFNALELKPETLVKHSVSIAGHRTSISLENAFWLGLKEIAAARGMALAQLIAEIDLKREVNLSSAIRVYVLAYYQGSGLPDKL